MALKPHNIILTKASAYKIAIRQNSHELLKYEFTTCCLMAGLFTKSMDSKILQESNENRRCVSRSTLFFCLDSETSFTSKLVSLHINPLQSGCSRTKLRSLARNFCISEIRKLVPLSHHENETTPFLLLCTKYNTIN